MAERIREAIRGRWLSTGVQVVILAVVLLAIASFSFRFHPHSGPLNLLGYGLILVAAGATRRRLSAARPPSARRSREVASRSLATSSARASGAAYDIEERPEAA